MNQVGGNVSFTRCGGACDSKEGSTQWIGFVGAFIAIIFFGSNFIPVKKFDTGDGELVSIVNPVQVIVLCVLSRHVLPVGAVYRHLDSGSCSEHGT